MPNTLTPLYIFKPGTHTDQHGTTLTFTESDLTACAAAYSPALHQAPLVVGHPVTNDPAWGWVSSLAFTGGRMLATPDQVDPAFAEMVNAGRYNKLSASFYTPSAPANPTPGNLYLRHVGFLGAQPPALKGLGNAAFSDADQREGVVTVEFTEHLKSSGVPLSNNPAPLLDGGVSPIKEPKTMPDPTPTLPPDVEAVLAQAEKDLRAKEAAFAEKEQKFNATVRATHAKENAVFVDSLVKAGKLLPRHRAPLTAFMEQVDDAGQIAFAEEGKEVQTPAGSWLKGFLESLPRQILFGEHVKPEGGTVAVGIDVPSGFTVDPDRGDVCQRALAYAESHKVGFVDAVRMIEKGAVQ